MIVSDIKNFRNRISTLIQILGFFLLVEERCPYFRSQCFQVDGRYVHNFINIKEFSERTGTLRFQLFFAFKIYFPTERLQ